jgi:adenylate kinase
MINLILFGPPGSGKGTQAAKLVAQYQLVHISTGDLFRYEMTNNTPLGQKAKAFMAAGQLVPDEVTIGMLKNKVVAHPEAKGFIFDGFPRTIPQAEALDNLLESLDAPILQLISLDVNEEEIVQRILKRGLDSGRSDDQNPAIIRNRIIEYREKTAPVFGFYEAQDKSVAISGMGKVEEIFDHVCEVINEARVSA